MKLLILLLIGFVFMSTGCEPKASEKNIVKYNLVKPGNGIYVVTEKNVGKEKINNSAHEKIYYNNNRIIKVERYDDNGSLTDNFSVSATTVFEYDSDNNVKMIKYFDKDGNKAEDELFGYWSIEYIYDEQSRVRMEIYRDADSKFLTVPRDNSGEIAKINFISPVLTYEYLDDKLKIKALDKNFNLLKEVFGDKPCIPFIDCGEND